jgi:hypothetical protein
MEGRQHFSLISMNDLVEIIALPNVEARWLPGETAETSS